MYAGSMRLFIVRHAKAASPPIDGSDHDRPLTPRGELQAAWLASVLAKMDEPPTRIVASTRVRTTQTAERIADALGLTVVPSETLARFEGFEVALGVIGEHGDADRLAIVGHNPQFSDLAWHLTGGRAAALRTGECVVLDVDTDPATGEVRPRAAGADVERLRMDD